MSKKGAHLEILLTHSEDYTDRQTHASMKGSLQGDGEKPQTPIFGNLSDDSPVPSFGENKKLSVQDTCQN